MTDKALAIREDMPLMELGKVLAQSGYFKDVKAVSQAVVKVLAGRELGIPPISAMTGIFIINERVTLSAGLMAAQVKRSGKYDYEVIHLGDDYVEISFKQDERELGRSHFSLEDAKRAGTKNIDKFPRNMLFARAMSNGVKWFTPDIFTTPVYTPEEMGAIVDADQNVLSVNAAIASEAVLIQDSVKTAQTEDGVYTENQIGPDFDATTLSNGHTSATQVTRTVNQSTGEVTTTAVATKPETKKPEAKAGESVVSAEFVEGALEYRTENNVKRVKWGEGWKNATEVSGKNLLPGTVDALLALFLFDTPGKPTHNKPNTYEAGNHLKKHFGGVKLWSSLTWEQLAAVFAWKKLGIPDERWYREEYAEWKQETQADNQAAVQSSAPVPVEIKQAVATPSDTVRKLYDIPENPAATGVSVDETNAFVENMAKLDDPSVLLPFLEAGMQISNQKHADHFFQTAQLLADKSVDVTVDENGKPNGEWLGLIEYIIGEAVGTKA